MCLWTGGFNIVKISILPKLIKLNAFIIKNQRFVEIDKTIIKFIHREKGRNQKPDFGGFGKRQHTGTYVARIGRCGARMPRVWGAPSRA